MAAITDEEEMEEVAEERDDPTDITADKLLNEINRIRQNSA